MSALRTEVILSGACLSIFATLAAAAVPTTLDDFTLPGTQPDTSGGADFHPIVTSGFEPGGCRTCHEQGSLVAPPIYDPWSGSMMGNAVRDPLFQACLAVANQDASFAGDLCIRCHSPAGWLGGRSVPTDGSLLSGTDIEGVNCNFCHRMVDPAYKPGISPLEDVDILAELSSNGLLPGPNGLHTGSYVVDPFDARRGPIDNVPFNMHTPAEIIVSPYHRTSELCANCHDVSNPVYTRQPDDSYMLNTLGLPHETFDKYEMFPVERTYSEWLNSTYAGAGVDHGGVFGGDHPTGVMRTCQDCHMPRVEDSGLCAFTGQGTFPYRNVASHDFHGGNRWAQDMIALLYPEDVDSNAFVHSKDGALYMLQNAATMSTVADGCSLTVTITNETGHKLPTGYPEGRRMWLTVQFYDSADQLLTERGAYDSASADLTVSDTKVYEAKLGLDAAAATATGLPEGESFHFVLNNTYVKDNRLPPHGFTNAAFAAIQASPVGATYADGQYWDTTAFRLPAGTVKAIVQLWYQSASKEYITFLRDENTNGPAGDELYDLWEMTGKSPPTLMEQAIVLGLTPAYELGDFDCNGTVDLVDHAAFADCISAPNASFDFDCTAGDFDLDGDVDLQDYAGMQARLPLP